MHLASSSELSSSSPFRLDILQASLIEELLLVGTPAQEYCRSFGVENVLSWSGDGRDQEREKGPCDLEM